MGYLRCGGDGVRKASVTRALQSNNLTTRHRQQARVVVVSEEEEGPLLSALSAVISGEKSKI